MFGGGKLLKYDTDRSGWMHQFVAMTQFALHLRDNFGKHRTHG